MENKCIISKGTMEDKDALIDFINMVFSQNERPHDFKKLMPKLYAEGIDTMDSHYLVKEDGRIRAVVGVYDTELEVAGTVLKLGQVGQVSVHPYARGSGYMKQLMHMAMEESRAKGIDALVLGGLRNRYEYFGFEPAEICLAYHFIGENVRHGCRDICVDGMELRPVCSKEDDCLDQMYALFNRQTFKMKRSRESFYEILKSWESHVFAILSQGEFAGYVCMSTDYDRISELMLKNINDFPAVLKLCFTQFQIQSLMCLCSAVDFELMDKMAQYCENCTISTGHSWHIFNFENVIRSFMKLKNQYTPLDDGEFYLKIAEEYANDEPHAPAACCGCYRLAVDAGVVTVEKLPGNAAPCDGVIEVNMLDAVTAIFTQAGAYTSAGRRCTYKNWFPLPLYMNPMDAC